MFPNIHAPAHAVEVVTQHGEAGPAPGGGQGGAGAPGLTRDVEPGVEEDQCSHSSCLVTSLLRSSKDPCSSRPQRRGTLPARRHRDHVSELAIDKECRKLEQ